MPKFDYKEHQKRMLEIVRVKQVGTQVPAQSPNNLPRLMNFLKTRGKIRTPQV